MGATRNKKAQYDDLYRVKRVDYQYSGHDDVWKSPFEAENNGNTDERRALPSPHIAFDKRVLSQTWDYDWLGNTSETRDDAKGFYDRSLGDITNSAAKPYQLTAASNAAGGGTRTGTLAARYDAAGNLTRLGVDRNGPCLPAGSACNQLFAYSWDEVGRLVTARRWDLSGSAVGVVDAPPPTELIGVTLQYAYDASDQRVLKSAPESGRHTVYLFESLELRRAQWLAGDYELTATTEVAYLFANGVRLARLAYEPDDEIPVIGGEKLHVFFELGDHLGSTSAAIDKGTGELVERRTYEAYGSTESDYRPERWGEFREDYGFTGKEDDVEVGLTYFGKRFLSTNLNRWVSADPLTIHALGGDLNAYAYVSGAVLKSVDPIGLQEASLTGPVPPPLVLLGTRTQATGQGAGRIARLLTRRICWKTRLAPKSSLCRLSQVVLRRLGRPPRVALRRVRQHVRLGRVARYSENWSEKLHATPWTAWCRDGLSIRM